MEDVAEAHTQLEDNSVIGKLVLRVSASGSE
jgi:hypothetical protein